MTLPLLTLEPTRLGMVAAADQLGLLGGLEEPSQACRAVFLAAEVGAIAWDEEAWPDLAFGVWSDGVEATTSRRRRSADTPTAELSTWLQLQPEWPQLGGTAIEWPLPSAKELLGFDDRLRALSFAAVESFNSIHDRAVRMARALVGDAPPVATPRPAPQPAHSPRRTFTAAGVAGSEHDVPDVLASLARSAEINAADGKNGERPTGVLAHLGHAVTVLPNGSVPLTGNAHHGRFLVTLTATIESPAHSVSTNGSMPRNGSAPT
ncbi:hypothetical protein JGU71_23635 [Antrihabitans sp. YC3-6]|uniref:Uncharacterized protein n=1 Tax=Antrihabitans stalagmiti TaxID=2799499 RepID=A0A934U5Z8_9NOCA|nr:hypothetical protein [Antrihabitans stalagmiti]MBJ8341882.1 hypothetical protein [Antrihabitans stalagmiti]